MDISQVRLYHFDFFGGAGTMVTSETGGEKFRELAFAAVLKVERDILGKTANFLALGDDSISAINLAAYAHKHGYSLSVSTILTNPLLQDMAKHIEVVDEVGSEASTVVEFKAPQCLYDQIDNVGLPMGEIDYIYTCPPGQS